MSKGVKNRTFYLSGNSKADIKHILVKSEFHASVT